MKTKQNDFLAATPLAQGLKPRWTMAAKFIAGFFLLAGLLPQIQAQTYSLAPAWSAAVGVANITTGDRNRGMAYDPVNNQVFVANRNGASSAIDVFNGTSGAVLSGSGISGAVSLAIDQVGVSDDGVLYGVPLTTSLSTTAGSLKVYSWTNWSANPVGYTAYQSTSTDAAVVNLPGAARRIGDTMAVTGSGTNTLILLGTGGANCQGTNFVLLFTTDGTNFISTAVFVPAGLPFTSSGGNIYGLAFYTNNTFIVVPGPGAGSASMSPYLIQFPPNFRTQATVVGTVLGNVNQTAFTAGRTTHITYAAGPKMLAMTQAATGGAGVSNTNAIFDASSYAGSLTQLVKTNFACATANGNNTAAIALGGAGRTNFMYVLQCNNGVQAYAISFTAAPVAPSIASAPVGITGAYPTYTLSVGANGSAPLRYQWLASNSIAATFTNIPLETNASFVVTTASTNYYRVIITNSVGSVTSSPVLVSLLKPTTSTVVTQLWRVATGTVGYSYLGTDGTTRGLGYDTNSLRLVVANTAGTIYILNATNGTNVGTLNMTGADVSEGNFPIDQVGVADDGAVYSGNLIINTSQRFKLNRWDAPSTSATAIVAYNDATDLLKNSGDRWGDTMAVRGAGANTQVLLASRSGTNVALFTTIDGTNFTAVIIPVTGVPAGFSGLAITFGDGNTFWSKTTGGDLRKISFDPIGLTASVIFDYLTGSQTPSSMAGIGVDSVRNILAGIVLNDTPHDLQLFQLTGSSDAPVLFHQGFFASANVNGNGSTAVAMKYPRVYGLDAVNGLVALSYDTPPTTAPIINSPPASQTTYTNIASVTFSASVSGSLPLYYQWQFSLTTNNAGFANIFGATNSSYTTNNPPVSVAGYYRVIARNVGGFATSAPPALLTLLVPTTSVVVTQLWTLPAGSLSFLDSTTYNTRGLAYDTNSGTVLVADNGNIHLLAATNGSYLGDLNSVGVFNGGYNGWLYDQIGVAADGTLYAANLAITGTGYSIVTWTPGYAAGSGATGYAYGNGTGGDPGSGSGDRWGDTMTVRGSGTSTEILIGSYNGTNVVLFTTTDGVNFTPNLIPVTGVPLGFSGQGIAFGDGDTFYTKSPGYLGRKVAFNRGTWTAAVSFLYATMPSDFGGIGVDVTAGILGGVNFSDRPNDLQLFLLSGNANANSLVNQSFFGSINANSQENSVTTLKGGIGFALNVNNGITAISYGVPNAPAVTLTSVAYAPGNVTINWNNNYAGHGYQTQYKNNLLDVSWTNLGSPVTNATATASYTDTSAAQAARFYRVVSQ